MQNILEENQNCIELNLPVTNANEIESVPVKVLSCIDPNIPKEKPKSKRRGYTTIISSSEYKESLLLSKSKRQPKKPKKKVNSNQPLALATNAVKVQVPVQFVQYSMMPLPFQSQPGFQVTNSTVKTPEQFIPSKKIQNTSTQTFDTLTTRTALAPPQMQPSTRIFPP